MSRSLGFCAAVVSLLVGCVAVTAPSAAPSALPSFGITTPAPATPSPAASATPDPTPTASPSAPPTASPTAEATQTPSAEPTETAAPVANDQLFFDDMDDPASGWVVGDNELVTSSYEGGSLRLVVHNGGGSGWSPRELGDEFGVVAVASQFEVASAGAVGGLCAADVNTFYGALLTTIGELVFFSIIDGQVTALDRVDDTDVRIAVGEPGVFAVECYGTSTGALRLVALMDDTGPLGVFETDEGPETFIAVALYGEAAENEFSVDFLQAAAYGIRGSATGMTPEGEDLLTHVPGLFDETCVESPVIGGNADAIMHCFLQAEGTGAELLQMASFVDSADMDAAYQEAVENFGVEPTGDCETGPDETTWNVAGGETLGRIQCAPQQVGIRFDWTDDALSILSTLIDFDGDYGNTYDLWLEAGPV